MTPEDAPVGERGIRYHSPRRREPGPVLGVAASLLVVLVAGQLALADREADDGADGVDGAASPVAAATTPAAPSDASDVGGSGAGGSGADVAGVAAGTAVVELAFDSGADTPSPGSTDALDQLADEVLGDPDATVRVIGHAEDSNDRDLEKQLSLERALRVVDLLARRGVPAERVQVVAAGATQAAGAADGDNRRVTVEVTPAAQRE